MTKRAQGITAAVLIGLIIVVLGWIAFDRGVFSFEEGSFGFNKSAITNPQPDLDREVTFPDGFSAEAQEIWKRNVATAKEAIAADPTTDRNAWLDLAIFYRMVGDNEGAVEIWEYIRKRDPSDAVSRRNLGEYYFHTVKDYPKAEMYYREAIDASPSMSINYTDLHEMYKYVYKTDTNAAADILIESINKVESGESIDMRRLLAAYYVEKSNVEQARVALTEARDLAKELGNTQLMYQLEQELARLR